MFLDLSHFNLDVYTSAKQLTFKCYLLSDQLPEKEKFNLVTQLRRASTSVQLNISEGCSRKSLAERKRFFEIARGSLVEIDSIFDIAFDLGYFRAEDLKETGTLLKEYFKCLAKCCRTSSVFKFHESRFTNYVQTFYTTRHQRFQRGSCTQASIYFSNHPHRV